MLEREVERRQRGVKVWEFGGFENGYIWLFNIAMENPL